VKTALVFGSESHGISKEVSAASDGDFTINMFGLTESLNVSVAAAVSMHWARFARAKALSTKSDLSERERTALLALWTSPHHHYGKGGVASHNPDAHYASAMRIAVSP
jgi:tRNA (guanosine-2'-O-)-methyltransferase